MSDVCGGTYNVIESKIVTTPGYPSPYAANLNCTWTIIAPLGHYLTASFLQVEISSPDSNCTSNSGLLRIRHQNATGEVARITLLTFLDLQCDSSLPYVENGTKVHIVLLLPH